MQNMGAMGAGALADPSTRGGRAMLMRIPDDAQQPFLALLRAQRELDHRTACEADPEPFVAAWASQRAEAAAACLHCPIRKQCGDYATAARERFGVWGGHDRESLAATGPSRKTCRGCGHQKSLTDYPPVRANRDGRGGTCRPCINAQRRAEYRDQREIVRKEPSQGNPQRTPAVRSRPASRGSRPGPSTTPTT